LPFLRRKKGAKKDVPFRVGSFERWRIKLRFLVSIYLSLTDVPVVHRTGFLWEGKFFYEQGDRRETLYEKIRR